MPPLTMPDPAPLLRLRLSRKADGSSTLDLRRPDGTSTWQKRAGSTAEFFAVHDLTHYAVESVLGFRRAFYGLVAEGWDFADFGHPWPRGPLPREALVAEVVVGAFDTHRAAHAPLTAPACRDAVRDYFATRGEEVEGTVSDVQLEAVRTLLSGLVRRWHALAPGGTMELEFPAAWGDGAPR